MRVVIVEKWFSEKMGYAENCLAKALAALGDDVHVVTSQAQVYYNTPFYQEVYEPYLGPQELPAGVKQVDGYTVHRLPTGSWRGRLTMRGLLRGLRFLQPEVVQTFDVTSPASIQAAAARLPLGYRFFTGNHNVASVFPFAREYPHLNWKGRLLGRAPLWLPGRAVSLASEKCYAVTTDAADIAVRFYGVPRSKVEISPLGVDTGLFCPPVSPATQEARRALRGRLGFAPSDIVCIYTGRFTAAKNPACLAQAVAALSARGLPYRAIFIGDGPQAEALRGASWAVLPFTPYCDLPAFYQCADIGVWPMEESTSMLDAAACGLPLVINGRLHALDHLAGAWLPYEAGDASDLARALVELAVPERRRALGDVGAARIERDFSWLAIARRRQVDYRWALGR